MSTKAIRELIAKVKGQAPWEDVGLQADKAALEIEAIERAAKARCELAEAIAEGDKDALERLAQMACDERNAALEEEQS